MQPRYVLHVSEADLGEIVFGRIYMFYRSPFQRLEDINICSERSLDQFVLLPGSSKGTPMSALLPRSQISAAVRGNDRSRVTFVEI